MVKHVELPGIITDNDQIVRKTVVYDTANQCTFSGYSSVTFIDNSVLCQKGIPQFLVWKYIPKMINHRLKLILRQLIDLHVGKRIHVQIII